MESNEISIRNDLKFPGIRNFDVEVFYSEVNENSSSFIREPHFHEKTEIYFNISGDVRFTIEQNVYPIRSGNIIVIHPNEYHRYAFQSSAPHRFYWILFPVSGEMENFIKNYSGHIPGVDNLIQLNETQTERFEQTCHSLLTEKMLPVKQYELFFRLLSLISEGEDVEKADVTELVSPEIRNALNYISEVLPEQLTIVQVADHVHVSVNTLERMFARHLGLSPSRYIRDKRLIMAREMLKQGYSVQEVCAKSGFADYSRFICYFRSRFGITPNKYRALSRNEVNTENRS